MWIPVHINPKDYEGKPWYVQLRMAALAIAGGAVGYVLASLAFTLVTYWLGMSDLTPTPVSESSFLDRIHDAILSWSGVFP